MKVVITGKAGQVVRCLTDRVADMPAFELVSVGKPEVDLENLGEIGEAIHRVRPDIVINAAAYTNVDQAEDEPDRAFRINAEAAGEAAQAAQRLAIPIIQVSTDYVFDGRSETAYSEDMDPSPLGTYGRSKFAGEEAVRSAAAEHLILRTAWVYSPYGRNFVKTIFEAAETRERLTVVSDQIGTPTSAFDIAEGLVAILQKWTGGSREGTGQTFHLAGSGEASWFDVASHIVDLRREMGLRAPEVAPIATADWPTRAERPARSMLNSDRFARQFGFRAPHWKSSVRDVVERLARR